MIAKNINSRTEEVNKVLAGFSEDVILKLGNNEQEQRWMDLAGDEVDTADDFDLEDLFRKY